jgi:predicted dienelactone hydrolase
MNRKFFIGCCAAILVVLIGFATESLSGQEYHGVPHRDSYINGDALMSAPDLAYRGNFAVGVRTLEVVDPDRIDIANYSEENPDPRYDRPLTLEVWYPAVSQGKRPQLTTYSDVLGRGANNPDLPNTPFKFFGRALRRAKPDRNGGPYPLVIVSHGYPGSRVLMSYLPENLASKGYVVVSIDHTDSTHADLSSFGNTLLNRTFDQLFVLNKMAELGTAKKHKSFLSGMVDADQTAIIGYSMGGYGCLITAGAGVSEYFITIGFGTLVPGGFLRLLQAGTPEYEALLDPRIKAIVGFAPWGAHRGVWDAAALADIKVPSLLIDGDQDRIADFSGNQFIFDNLVNSDRYMLIYQGGAHNIAVNALAPPVPDMSYTDFLHYQEPAWDLKRINNINQHFISAFLGIQLKGEAYEDYLDLVPLSNDSHQTDETDPTYWTGFPTSTAINMEFYHLP